MFLQVYTKEPWKNKCYNQTSHQEITQRLPFPAASATTFAGAATVVGGCNITPLFHETSAPYTCDVFCSFPTYFAGSAWWRSIGKDNKIRESGTDNQECNYLFPLSLNHASAHRKWENPSSPLQLQPSSIKSLLGFVLPSSSLAFKWHILQTLWLSLQLTSIQHENPSSSSQLFAFALSPLTELSSLTSSSITITVSATAWPPELSFRSASILSLDSWSMAS